VCILRTAPAPKARGAQGLGAGKVRALSSNDTLPRSLLARILYGP
jgi:hypothetical protein